MRNIYPAIILPTYNESKNIKPIVASLLEVLPEASIIIVDDNSPDKTGNIARKLMMKYKNLKVINRESKKGRGSAVIDGLRFALKYLRANAFVEMDADFSHNPAELPKLLSGLRSNVVVLGSRYLPTSSIRNWPPERHILSYLSNMLIRLLLPVRLADYTNGYRAYNRKAALILANHKFTSTGYITLSESIILLYKNGFYLKEVPTVFINRRSGQSNTTTKEFGQAFLDIWQIAFLNRNREMKIGK